MSSDDLCMVPHTAEREMKSFLFFDAWKDGERKKKIFGWGKIGEYGKNNFEVTFKMLDLSLTSNLACL